MVNLVELASRLKKSRLSLGLTLDQLAEKAGLAKGLLSKVENFRVTPSLPTIAKLADALGVSLSSLFDGLDNIAEVGITKLEDRVEIDRDREHSTIRYYSLAHHRPNRRMDPFILKIPVEGGRDRPLAHEGEEFLTILDGSVNLEVGDEVISLNTGDSAYFNAETPHRVQNQGESEATALCIFLESNR